MAGTEEFYISSSNDPFVEVAYFADNPNEHKKWLGCLALNRELLTDRFWNFFNDPKGVAVKVINELIRLHADNDAYAGIGLMTMEPAVPDPDGIGDITAITFTKSSETTIVNPDGLIDILIGAVNADLRAEDHQYYLPLEPKEEE